MKLKSNRLAVIPVMCSHCKRYVWMEPYRSGETWNRCIDRFVKIRLCNECVERYGVGGTYEKSNNKDKSSNWKRIHGLPAKIRAKNAPTSPKSK